MIFDVRLMLNLVHIVLAKIFIYLINNMILRNLAIGLNISLVALCIGFFIGHGTPSSLMLWISAGLWLVAPLVNLLHLIQSEKKNKCNIN